MDNFTVDTSPAKKCVFFALLIVSMLIILILIVRWSSKSPKAELMQNVGYPYAFGASSYNQGYGQYPQSGISKGAYMRNLGQEMSQPVQGEYTSMSAMRVKGIDNFVYPETEQGIVRIVDPAIGEHLTGSRGEPDFWELPQELRSAQVRQAGARLENFAVGGTNTRAAYDVDAYVYPFVY